jgi:hypothetical protein
MRSCSEKITEGRAEQSGGDKQFCTASDDEGASFIKKD